MAIIDRDILYQVAAAKRVRLHVDDDNDGIVSDEEEENITQAMSAAESDVMGKIGGEFAQATIEANDFVTEITALRAIFYLNQRRPPLQKGVFELFEWTGRMLDELRTGKRDLWDGSAVAPRIEAFVQSTTADQQPIFSQTEYDTDGEEMEPDVKGTLDEY